MKVNGAVELLKAGVKFAAVAVLLSGCLTTGVAEAATPNMKPVIDGAFKSFYDDVYSNAGILAVPLSTNIHTLRIGGFEFDFIALELAKQLYYVFIEKFVLLNGTNAALIGLIHGLPTRMEQFQQPKVVLNGRVREMYKNRMGWFKKCKLAVTASTDKYIKLLILSDALLLMTMLCLLSSNRSIQGTGLKVFEEYNGIYGIAHTVEEANSLIPIVHNMGLDDNKVTELTNALRNPSRPNAKRQSAAKSLPGSNKKTFQSSYKNLINQWKNHYDTIGKVENAPVYFAESADPNTANGLVEDSRVLALLGLACAFDERTYVVNEIKNLVNPEHLKVDYQMMRNGYETRRYLETESYLKDMGPVTTAWQATG